MSGSWMLVHPQQTSASEAELAAPTRKRKHHKHQQQHVAQQDDESLGFLTRIRVRRPVANGSSQSEEEREQDQEEQHRGSPKAVQPLAVAAVSAISAYYTIKGILGGYQQLRRRNLRHLIRTVAPVLDSLGATYWVDFGSLLGAHRENDVIIHDNDADMVLLNPDWDALLPALRAALPQFRVFFVVPSEDRSIRWIRLLSGVGVMDLYGAFDSGEGVPPGMISIPQGHGDLCDIPSSLVFPLSVIKFRGVAVSAPGDVHGVLTYRYGADYMVPKYMNKGRDSVEQGKFYARLLGALGKAGFRV